MFCWVADKYFESKAHGNHTLKSAEQSRMNKRQSTLKDKEIHFCFPSTIHTQTSDINRQQLCYQIYENVVRDFFFKIFNSNEILMIKNMWINLNILFFECSTVFYLHTLILRNFMALQQYNLVSCPCRRRCSRGIGKGIGSIN